MVAAQTVNSVFFVLPNAYVLAGECRWFDVLTYWSAYIQWNCWATIFLLFVIQAKNTMPWVSAKGATPPSYGAALEL